MKNLSESSVETMLQKCLDAVSVLAGSSAEKNAEKYLQELGLFNKTNFTSHAVYEILDMKTMSFKYVSNTALSLGIPEEELMEKGLSLILSSMVPDPTNVAAVPTLLKFVYDSLREIPREFRENFIAYGYGMKYYRPSKNTFHTLVQMFGLEFDEHGFPTLCFIIDQDVEHLVRNLDYYVGRVSCTNYNYVTTYSSKEVIGKKQDIFSEREIDVLKMLLKGYESKQIAEKLFISSNTVDNHRKNMIRKLSARDTTALVQLAKLMGILR